MNLIYHSDTSPRGFWQKRFGPIAGSFIAFLVEVIQIVIISAAIIIPVRYFLIQPFYVKGASMEPTFFEKEYLIIDEITFRFRVPERGEVIVFRYPKDPSEFFIKRIIGIPGDTIEITDGRITIYNEEHPNGVLLNEESYLEEKTTGRKRTTLNANEYYVLGDNRDASLDSRNFGPIVLDDMVGRVWIRGLPLSRASVFEVPHYNF